MKIIKLKNLGIIKFKQAETIPLSACNLVVSTIITAGGGGAGGVGR